jgi:hypothetical protein
MRSKVFSDWLPSFIKATRPVVEIFKMARYFPDSPRIYAIFLIIPAQSAILSLCELKKIWALRVVWSAYSRTANLHFSLLIAWSSFVLLGRAYLIRVLDWPKPLHIFHQFRCSCLKRLITSSLPTTKEMPTVWSDGTPLVPSFANLSTSSFPGILWCPHIHIKVTVFYPLCFSNACVTFRTRTDSMVICYCCYCCQNRHETL